jgi:RNA polymerase sigma-70 factor, ECF subfamily
MPFSRKCRGMRLKCSAFSTRLVPNMTHSDDLTLLIQQWQNGNREAGDALIEKLYLELKKIARAYLSNERRDHTLAPTALVNELYLKFIKSGSPFAARNRSQFLALAALSLRQILVDHARMRSARKRGGGVTVTLISADMALAASDQDLLQLDKVLTQLEALDARAARVVELRFFGGLNEQEVAHNLRVSTKTVQRDWKMARAWLVSHLPPREKGGCESPPRRV